MDDPCKLVVAQGYQPTAQDLLSVCDQIRATQQGDCARVAIVVEFEDGSRVTYEHDEMLRAKFDQ